MEIKSLREAISLVRTDTRLMNKTDELTDRAIGSYLNNTALFFIKQITDKRKLWNSANIFTPLKCVPMQNVPLAECGIYKANCEISRSIVRLPKIAEGNNFGMLIQGIWSVDIVSRRLIESDPNRYSNSLDLGLKTNEIHYWIEDNYLYLGQEGITNIRMAAYFEEDVPDEFIDYPSNCGKDNSHKGCCAESTTANTVSPTEDCCPPNPYDMPFRCPGYLYKNVIDEVVKQILGEYDKAPESTTTGIPQSKK